MRAIDKIVADGTACLGGANRWVEVTLNIARGDRDLDKLDVLIDDVVVATQTFAQLAAPAEAAADQEAVTLNVPTTQLRMGSGTYVPVVFNGGANISANLYEVDAEAPIPTNDVPVVMATRFCTSVATLVAHEKYLPGWLMQRPVQRCRSVAHKYRWRCCSSCANY